MSALPTQSSVSTADTALTVLAKCFDSQKAAVVWDACVTIMFSFLYSAISSICACLCTGALVRSIEQDSRLDQAVVTLLTVASERILAVLTPPEAVPQQPLTLALLQVRPQACFATKALCIHDAYTASC